MKAEFFSRTNFNHIKFVLEGDVYYEQYLNLIKNAQQSIHLQTYIFENDLFGQEVQNELINASLRGVQIYLLIDSVGSMNFSTESEQNLLRAGINFCRFNGVQFKWLGQWGRRLHHKILLVDASKALIGGINVVSASFKNPTVPHQLDFAVYLEGPVTVGLTLYCQTIFNRAGSRRSKFKKDNKLRNIDPEGVELKISINDWIFQRWHITKQYSEITREAKKEIIILNSYFFPRKKFMKQLAAAAKNGVKVKLILPKISDWPSYVLATQYLYNYFLKNDVEIYQWTKSIMHGKMATVDGQWSTIGSFNLNYTSYQQNLEMNVDIFSAQFTEQLNNKIKMIIDTGCEKVTTADFIDKASLKTRVLRFVCYVLLNLIANFSIGLAFQEEEKRRVFLKRLHIGASLLFLILGTLGMLAPSLPSFLLFLTGFLLLYRQNKYNDKNV